QAGLQVDDVITSFDGNKFTSANFPKVLARYKPGDKVPVTVLRGGHSITTTVTLAPPQVFDYRIEEDPQATPQAKALRVAWLSGK
ncbi:MAG TPA: PDZ domain-containing protein, partial [Pyrinomonadaceae bacterium]|nr:PDZ domain-containing protein [Pyrinomonadaceae bacterium]